MKKLKFLIGSLLILHISPSFFVLIYLGDKYDGTGIHVSLLPFTPYEMGWVINVGVILLFCLIALLMWCFSSGPYSKKIV
jgi:hypothetical protein